MPNSKKDKKTNKTKRRIAIMSAILLFLILISLTPYAGDLSAYSKWARCGFGDMPVQSDTDLHLADGDVPNYRVAPYNYGFFLRTPKYFCTPLEAEQAGYSANARYYEFPHLPKDQWQSAIDKSKAL